MGNIFITITGLNHCFGMSARFSELSKKTIMIMTKKQSVPNCLLLTQSAFESANSADLCGTIMLQQCRYAAKGKVYEFIK